MYSSRGRMVVDEGRGIVHDGYGDVGLSRLDDMQQGVQVWGAILGTE